MFSPLAGAFVTAVRVCLSPAADAPDPTPPTAVKPEAPGDAEASQVVLSMQIPEDGGGDFDERLERAIRAHGQDAGLRVEPDRYVPEALDLAELPERSERVVRETPATSVVWVLRSEQGVALVLFEGHTGRLFLREADPGASDSLLVETIVNITMSVGLALESGDPQQLEQLEEISVDALTRPPEEPEPPQRVEPSAQPEPSLAEPGPTERTPVEGVPAQPTLAPARHAAPVWLGAAYFGSTFAQAIPWQHGIALRATWRMLPRFLMLAGYDVVFPSTARLGDIDFALRRHPIRLGVGTRSAVSRRVDLGAETSVVVDPIGRRALTDGSVTDDTLRTFVAAAAQGGVGVHLAPRIRLGVDVGVELLLTRARYVVRGADASASLQPHRARFTVAAGLQVGLGPWRSKDGS